jgi:hypothetical protein
MSLMKHRYETMCNDTASNTGAARAPEISITTGAWDDELANTSKQDNTSLDDDEDEDVANQRL